MLLLDNPVYVKRGLLGLEEEINPIHVVWCYEFCVDAVFLLDSAFALARGTLEILLTDFALVYIMEN